ncbi:MAG TPA: hypothetical protein VFV53_05520, partial [Candidatus Limnocylindrales bacterium]|nr:hypothetical protein [Candidatus Limnocylindrales bacterium]
MSTGPPSALRPGRATLVSAVLVAVASVAFLAGPVGWAAGNIREGFPGYYTAARLVIEGRWNPRVYDDTWFARETLAATDGRTGEIYRPNPPVASLIVLPFAGLDVIT